MLKYTLALCALVSLILGGAAAAVVAQDRQGPPPGRGRGAGMHAPVTPGVPAQPGPMMRGQGRGQGQMRGPGQGPMRGPGPHRGPLMVRPFAPLYRPYPYQPYISRPYYLHWSPFVPFGLSATWMGGHVDAPVVASGTLKWEVTPETAVVFINDKYAGTVKDLKKGVALPLGVYVVTVYGDTGKQEFPVELYQKQTITIRAKLN